MDLTTLSAIFVRGVSLAWRADYAALPSASRSPPRSWRTTGQAGIKSRMPIFPPLHVVSGHGPLLSHSFMLQARWSTTNPSAGRAIRSVSTFRIRICRKSFRLTLTRRANASFLPCGLRTQHLVVACTPSFAKPHDLLRRAVGHEANSPFSSRANRPRIPRKFALYFDCLEHASLCESSPVG
jgi:hypothetical protein